MLRISCLTVATLILTAAALADDTASHPFATTAARGNIHRVLIDVSEGDVRIRNGAPDRIDVRGIATRRYDGSERRQKAQAIADGISAEVVIDGDEAIVKRHYGPGAQSWSARSFHSQIELTVEIPPGVDVELWTRYGDIDIEGVFGNIDADLRAGDVEIRTPRANVRDLTASVSIGEVHTYLGDHFIENEGVFPRTARFHNAAGKSKVNAHATFGDVHVTLTR